MPLLPKKAYFLKNHENHKLSRHTHTLSQILRIYEMRHTYRDRIRPCGQKLGENQAIWTQKAVAGRNFWT